MNSELMRRTNFADDTKIGKLLARAARYDDLADQTIPEPGEEQTEGIQDRWEAYTGSPSDLLPHTVMGMSGTLPVMMSEFDDSVAAQEQFVVLLQAGPQGQMNVTWVGTAPEDGKPSAVVVAAHYRVEQHADHKGEGLTPIIFRPWKAEVFVEADKYYISWNMDTDKGFSVDSDNKSDLGDEQAEAIRLNIESMAPGTVPAMKMAVIKLFWRQERARSNS